MENVKHKGLKKEVDETLMFFIESDMKIYGKVTDSTKEAFRVQNVEIPAEYQDK